MAKNMFWSAKDCGGGGGGRKSDGNASHHKNEEHQQDVGDEPDGPPRPVGLLDRLEVEVSQDQPELGEERVLQAAEDFDLECKGRRGRRVSSQLSGHSSRLGLLTYAPKRR